MQSEKIPWLFRHSNFQPVALTRSAKVAADRLANSVRATPFFQLVDSLPAHRALRSLIPSGELNAMFDWSNETLIPKLAPFPISLPSYGEPLDRNRVDVDCPPYVNLQSLSPFHATSPILILRTVRRRRHGYSCCPRNRFGCPRCRLQYKVRTFRRTPIFVMHRVLHQTNFWVE